MLAHLVISHASTYILQACSCFGICGEMFTSWSSLTIDHGNITYY